MSATPSTQLQVANTIAGTQLAPTDALTTSIQSLDPAMAMFLSVNGLPTENLLAPASERRHLVMSLASVLGLLPIDRRAKAEYLSKFVVAAAVGLFDASLDYLWNETVKALRKHVVEFDLSYFFDVVEKRESHRARLKGEDDLAAIDDFTLLDGCVRVGILDDVNRERLRHINYMRNHASAAHATKAQLNGHELLSWLANCLRYAINAKVEVSVLQVQRLLTNLRAVAMEGEDLQVILAEIGKLGVARSDDLLWTIFGMFVDPKSSQTVRTNIEKIAARVWDCASEDRKYEVGARYHYFAKHLEVQKKGLADQFLNTVDGQRYKPDDLLALDLLDRLANLKQAHNSFNNFYNEAPHAAALETSLPKSGLVPRAARKEWVKVIVQCFIGNGKGFRDGVDEGAVKYYEKFIMDFTEAEVATFLHLMDDSEFTLDFGAPTAFLRFQGLINHLMGKFTALGFAQALHVLAGATAANVRQIATSTQYKTALATLPSFEQA